MNTMVTANQRLVTILLVLLIFLVVLLILGIVTSFLMMGGGMMRGMTGMNGSIMNDLMSACSDMMRNFQTP